MAKNLAAENYSSWIKIKKAEGHSCWTLWEKNLFPYLFQLFKSTCSLCVLTYSWNYIFYFITTASTTDLDNPASFS